MSLITPDFGLLVWMTVIFGIVFFILAKFGFPLITSMVDKRADHIQQALQDAAKAKEELEGMQATCQKMLDQTRSEQAKMLETAKATSRQMVEQAREQAAKEASALIAKARETIELEKTEAIDQVRNTVVDLSIAVSEKILRSKLKDEDVQADMLDRIIREIKDNASKE